MLDTKAPPLLPALLLLAACATTAATQGSSAPTDAAPAPPVETVAVPASGAPAAFTTSLAAGELYLLRASGVVAVGGVFLDAEFGGFNADGSDAADALLDTDVGIDIGVRELWPATGRKPAPPSTVRAKWFGGPRRDHVYYLLVTGEGRALSLTMVTPGRTGGAATDAIQVSLYRLSPAPTIGAPVETVIVDGVDPTPVHSKFRPEEGRVYLLQVAGELQVGGPGNLGDAEFHDYKRDGRGNNEGEAGADFGVGVDEPDVRDHPQRTRKWGAWRQDHTYYMLYAGTGQPLGFNYHDSGGRSGRYRDNAGSLPLKIFALP